MTQLSATAPQTERPAAPPLACPSTPMTLFIILVASNLVLAGLFSIVAAVND